MNFVCPPYLLHAPPISFFLIWSPKNYLVRSAAHRAPDYVVFSTPLIQAQISFSAPCSWTLSAYIPPWTWETKFHAHVKKKVKIVVLCILVFIFLHSKLEDKRFCTEW
jgi:hypothetical protein